MIAERWSVMISQKSQFREKISCFSKPNLVRGTNTQKPGTTIAHSGRTKADAANLRTLRMSLDNDAIHPEMIKFAGSRFNDCLLHNVKRSLDERCFPWKFSKVIFLQKQDQSDYTNIRRIDWLPFQLLRKIVERLPAARLRVLFQSNKSKIRRARRLVVTSEHCQVIVKTEITLPRSQKKQAKETRRPSSQSDRTGFWEISQKPTAEHTIWKREQRVLWNKDFLIGKFDFSNSVCFFRLWHVQRAKLLRVQIHRWWKLARNREYWNSTCSQLENFAESSESLV